MNSWNLFNTILMGLFGSGGIILWILNRISKKKDQKDNTQKDISEIKESMALIQKGLIVALENDQVIFMALRNHEINGESEKQDKKMNEYFISLLQQ